MRVTFIFRTLSLSLIRSSFHSFAHRGLKPSVSLYESGLADRWGPLMGPSKAFDPNRFFILCANVAGSPYGTVSPISINPDTGEPYGPSFPPTSIRDDVLCASRPFLS